MIVCDCGGVRELELEKLAFLKQKSVDAYVLLPSLVTAKDLEDIDKTVVLFDRPIENYSADTVSIDNAKAGYVATKYLLDRGHREIAAILGGKNVYTSDLRYQGYLRAFEEYGITPDPEFEIHTDFTLNQAYEQTVQLIRSGKKTTAILTTNSDTTLGCVMALNYLGVSIPSQISVMGFDNLVMSKISNPSITIIYQPLEKIGSKIADMLIKRLDGDKSEHVTEVMDIELIEGSSVKNILVR